MAFPKMKSSTEFVAHVRELLSDVPDVAIKSMFGGHGIFREGLMFGCLASDVLYLRADGDNRDRRLADGAQQFGVEMRGKPMHMPYFSAPSEALEDADVLTELAHQAFADALAVDQAKPASKQKHAPGK